MTTERSVEGENHPSPGFNRTKSRLSQASGLLSIITLPSFISNDRPRPSSYSAGVEAESPVRSHHRKWSSLFGQILSGIGITPPVSPVNDVDASDKGSRPTSGALRSITSMLKRSDSAPTSSRRPPRRFTGRTNLSLGTGDEAVTEWRRLPPLPSTQGLPTTRPSQSHRTTGAEDSSTQRSPSYYEEKPKPLGFLAPHVPLPPSPSTRASSGSSLVYAPPSPAEIPPVNGSTTPCFLYPPLPPSIPSTPGPCSYPHSVDESMGTHTIHATDQTVSGVTNNGPLPCGTGNDEVGQSIYRGSTVSAFSQHSIIQELVLPPAALSTPPPSPSRPVSPRGPRPQPTPGQPSLSRSAAHSQTGPTGQ